MSEFIDIREEHWKYVLGYEKLYAVSTHGRVVSMRKGLLKPRLRYWSSKRQPSQRYLVAKLCREGISKLFPVHKLVLTAWRGPRQTEQQCRHLDGNRLNNRLSNLLWGTRKENRDDRRKHRTGIKLTPTMVRYIRNSTKTNQMLAAELGCGKSTVSAAKQRRYWVDI